MLMKSLVITRFSNVPFEKGRQYTVKELYHSIVIFSANGSSIALAELLAGSEKTS